MSQILEGVLRMPPALWTGDPLDVAQRHSRYVEAADTINELRQELATAATALAREAAKVHQLTRALADLKAAVANGGV